MRKKNMTRIVYIKICERITSTSKSPDCIRTLTTRTYGLFYLCQLVSIGTEKMTKPVCARKQLLWSTCWTNCCTSMFQKLRLSNQEESPTPMCFEMRDRSDLIMVLKDGCLKAHVLSFSGEQACEARAHATRHQALRRMCKRKRKRTC